MAFTDQNLRTDEGKFVERVLPPTVKIGMSGNRSHRRLYMHFLAQFMRESHVIHTRFSRDLLVIMRGICVVFLLNLHRAQQRIRPVRGLLVILTVSSRNSCVIHQ